MICIVSNNQDYSDHTIYFVETSSKGGVEQLLRMYVKLANQEMGWEHTPMSVIGVVPSVEWDQADIRRRRGQPQYTTMSLDRFSNLMAEHFHVDKIEVPE